MPGDPTRRRGAMPEQGSSGPRNGHGSAPGRARNGARERSGWAQPAHPAEEGDRAVSGTPSFSVVIPAHNRATLVGRAVRSVLAQTFADLEVIVVDDASTDDTREVVRAFADPRVRLVALQENRGNAAARNAGVRAARGALVTFLDSDDEAAPELLEEVARVLRGTPPEVGFAWTDRKYVLSGGDRKIERRPGAPADGDDRGRYLAFLREFRAGTNSGLTVKRECFEVVGGFDERLRAAVDTDFVLRLVKRYGCRKVEKPLVLFHQHDGLRVSRNRASKAAAYSVIIEKHREALEADTSLWIKYHYRAAWLHYHAGNGPEGRRLLLRGLRRVPLHMKSWTALVVFTLFGQGGARIHRSVSERRKRSWRTEAHGGGVQRDVSTVRIAMDEANPTDLRAAGQPPRPTAGATVTLPEEAAYGSMGAPAGQHAEHAGSVPGASLMRRLSFPGIPRGWQRNRLVVLAYHDVRDPELFRTQVEWLRESMNPVDVGEVIRAQAGDHELPPRAVLVTFDDGERSVYEQGFPLLREYSVPAVVFVVAGLIGTDEPFWFHEARELVRRGARLERFATDSPDTVVRRLKQLSNDERRRVLERLRGDFPGRVVQSQLTPEELRELEAGGLTIGNHTHTHPCLDQCDDCTVHGELMRAHHALTGWLGRETRVFAYPNGNGDRRAEAVLAELGYGAAFLFDHWICRLPAANPFRISRVRVSSTTPMRRFRNIISGLHPLVHHMLGRS
jgi:glycosyltransferase involved in cell wall biosynthesis/peptidoglycan/xylan/chitin deacetylase (PgdA/CDA1 family)